jgi:branched-subunit amino acid ABC-type transport system permease component
VTNYVVFMLLGLGSGAVYAGLAMGLVVQYKATGIVNFSYGAMAMLAAYQYDDLHAHGDLVLPWVGLPARFHIADHISATVAMLLTLMMSGLLGLLLYAVVFRPLRSASPLARVAASVGVMLVLQAIVLLQFGTEARLPMRILPAASIDLFGITFPRDRFYLAILTALVAVALWALFRFSRFGLASRAAAESERGALLTLISPRRLAAINMVLVAMLAGFFGIIVSPITGLDPTKFTLFVVPALAAALIGRLTLISVTAIAGLALGMSQSELLFLAGKPWFPQWARSGATDALPFIVIAVVLFATGHRLPVRGMLAHDRTMRSLRRGEHWQSTAVWLVCAGIAVVALHDQYRYAVVTSLIGVMIMMSFVVLTGYLGQISLAQGAVAGCAGFALSRLTDGAGLPFPIAPLLAALIATVVGCVVGIPGLRVRGVQLAVVTLAGAVAIERLIFNNADLTGGITGAVVSVPKLFGLDLDPRTSDQRPSIAFGIVCLVIVAMLGALVAFVRRSTLGRRMISVRSNERAAAASGIDVVRVKVAGFALASFIAGVGGAMLGYQQTSVSASSFTVFIGLQWLALAYLGGITSISGAFIAGLLLPGGLLQTILSDVIHLGRYSLLLSGLGVIVTAVANPEGLAAKVAERAEAVRSRPRSGRPARLPIENTA